jgi:hypothetical protein
MQYSKEFVEEFVVVFTGPIELWIEFVSKEQLSGDEAMDIAIQLKLIDESKLQQSEMDI